MDELIQLLNVLGQASFELGVDPAAIVALHSRISLPAAALLAVFGLLTCLFGAGKAASRVVLFVPAASIGFFALGPHAAMYVHLSKALGAYAAAGLLGALALVSPPALLGLSCGGLGGVLGSQLVESPDFWMGFIPGFLILGAITIFAFRFLSILISGLIGAAGLGLGVATLLSATPLAGLVTRSPTITISAFGCLAVCSIAYQLKFSPTEDELAKKHADKQRQRQLSLDAKERDKRLKSYGKSKR